MNKVTLMSLSLALITGSVVLTLQPAEARRWNMGVNGRQARQQSRIYNGINNGSLNRREASRLERQEGALKKQERYYRSTGNGLSNSERARLEREQNQISQNIYQQKHDGQGNGWGNGGGNPGNGGGNGWGHQGYNHGVNARQDHQQDRIYNGVQDGQLTQREYGRLENQQSMLAAQEARYRASGNGLSQAERARLEREQNELSRNIRRQENDGQHN